VNEKECGFHIKLKHLELLVPILKLRVVVLFLPDNHLLDAPVEVPLCTDELLPPLEVSGPNVKLLPLSLPLPLPNTLSLLQFKRRQNQLETYQFQAVIN
jgi:hypothetical protein